MKIIFLCFTPYQIKVSNWLSIHKFNNYNKTIIISSFSGIEKEKLIKFAGKDCYENIFYFNLNYKIKDILKKPIKYKKLFKKELKQFIDINEKINPDILVYFSDNPIPYQILLRRMKLNKKQLIHVEEGTALYITQYSFTFKQMFSFYLRKLMFGDINSKLFHHGKSGFQDILLLREPELVETKSEKIKISPVQFKEIISNNVNNSIILEDIGTLFCPSYTFYNKKIRNIIFEEIFYYYYNQKKNLYIKLHPAEKNIEDIIILAEKYYPFVKLINDNSITSDEILLNEKVVEVLSDYSSVLVNAYYLRQDINIISYDEILSKKYGIKINHTCSIIEKLKKDGVITSFLIE